MALGCFLKSFRMPSAPVTKFRSDRLMIISRLINIKESSIGFLYLIFLYLILLTELNSRNFVRVEDGSRIFKNSAHKSSRHCLLKDNNDTLEIISTHYVETLGPVFLCA